MSTLREQATLSPLKSVPPTYRTNSLHFSVWLICENLLSYDHCALVGTQVMFCFADPEGRGDQLQAQWLASNPLLPQKTVVEILRTLRSQMTTVLQAGGR